LIDLESGAAHAVQGDVAKDRETSDLVFHAVWNHVDRCPRGDVHAGQGGMR
jgi:hypothetical protein